MSDRSGGIPGFTIRAAVIAVFLSLFLLTCTTYIALKLGIAPWPIIFSVVVSSGFLKVLSRGGTSNIHEINVAQAGASIGGLVAAGVAFTVPGILFLNRTEDLRLSWPNPWLLGALVLLAGVLGIVLSVPLKYTFIDKEELPYPAGTAGAELLKAGKAGGKQLYLVILVGAAAAVFALLRDTTFPAGFSVGWLAMLGIFVTLLPYPLFVAGGYILGTGASFSWFFGAAIGWLVVVPILFQKGYNLQEAQGFARNLGMGIVLGAGLGFFASYVLPRLKEIFAPIFSSDQHYWKSLPLLAGLSIILMVLQNVPVGAAVLSLLGVWMMVAVAARMTGETNIDPLEQFGIFVGLMIALVYSVASLELSPSVSFVIVTFVSVACAVAGDAGHDYKSAHILGTRFSDIIKVDIVAVVFTGIAAPFVLKIITDGFQEHLFTPAMPAPQAQMVAGSIFGFDYPLVFAGGFAVAFVAQILYRFLPVALKSKVLLMPFGIGLFLGLGLALPLALGAVIRVVVDRRRPASYYAGLVLAAGIMGGEGFAGFAAGALTVFGLDFSTGAFILMAIAGTVGIAALVLWLRAGRTPPEAWHSEINAGHGE